MSAEQSVAAVDTEFGELQVVGSPAADESIAVVVVAGPVQLNLTIADARRVAAALKVCADTREDQDALVDGRKALRVLVTTSIGIDGCVWLTREPFTLRLERKSAEVLAAEIAHAAAFVECWLVSKAAAQARVC